MDNCSFFPCSIPWPSELFSVLETEQADSTGNSFCPDSVALGGGILHSPSCNNFGCNAHLGLISGTAHSGLPKERLVIEPTAHPIQQEL